MMPVPSGVTAASRCVRRPARHEALRVAPPDAVEAPGIAAGRAELDFARWSAQIACPATVGSPLLSRQFAIRSARGTAGVDAAVFLPVARKEAAGHGDSPWYTRPPAPNVGAAAARIPHGAAAAPAGAGKAAGPGPFGRARVDTRPPWR